MLFGLFLTGPSKRWLHKEDFFFTASQPQPSQYWLLGYHDRNLEEEYLEDLAATSARDRVAAGFMACILVTILGPVLDTVCAVTIFR